MGSWARSISSGQQTSSPDIFFKFKTHSMMLINYVYLMLCTRDDTVRDVVLWYMLIYITPLFIYFANWYKLTSTVPSWSMHNCCLYLYIYIHAYLNYKIHTIWYLTFTWVYWNVTVQKHQLRTTSISWILGYYRCTRSKANNSRFTANSVFIVLERSGRLNSTFVLTLYIEQQK